MSSDRKLKLIWDFRGPTASQVALHHEIHLKEYIRIEKLSDIITGVKHIHKMHSIAYVILMETQMKAVRDALKPHRGQLIE